ncbi:mitochondrial ribosomal protein L22 [Megachile rotundata]|uniref:mitochondrial ribosomal protein L22 n=1 Tax=Megachile rotundata TaxID=143995 RepID=UPI000258D6A5|nr:PREDICTED: 39S ribosomal protein L22, mitochondrial [Megachile rotundata]XP_012154260.1 PREDICTED: 39S ribosomal protein L22, mitochondrial [Megachile rotundata]XP_012154261.1 PREDICTED: 39S ribosomal protein L22, mitochondrial [Megachile rotundata]XP_012154262.1 PREDICTED: 39S ribosomal protein L22, mitochondrial [Megachile rotundata]
MQHIKRCVQQFIPNNVFGANNLSCLYSIQRTFFGYNEEKNHSKFLKNNETIFPPQKPGEERRPGYVCHMRKNIKYSPLNMWYIACFVRGMSVDEAVKQLSFLKKKGAAIAKEVILDAQKLAVENHNIEFKSNLWVAESFATKGITIKGIRRHAKMRAGTVRYRYCNYYVRLEEGKPPKHYYAKDILNNKTGEELLKQWIDRMHERKVNSSL